MVYYVSNISIRSVDKLKEYKLRWIRFLWETGFTFVTFWFMFKIIMVILSFLMITEGTDQLIWLVILGMFGMTVRFRVPKFYNFVRGFEGRGEY